MKKQEDRTKTRSNSFRGLDAKRSCVLATPKMPIAQGHVNGPYANHGLIITRIACRALSAVIQSKFNGERIAIADKPYIQRET